MVDRFQLIEPPWYIRMRFWLGHIGDSTKDIVPMHPAIDLAYTVYDEERVVLSLAHQMRYVATSAPFGQNNISNSHILIIHHR
jgi:hypothetical protein